MRILNLDGTERAETAEALAPLGTLAPETINTVYHEAEPGTPGAGHYETVAEYPGGGRDVVWVVDDPGVPPTEAWWETEQILRFTPFTDAEVKARQIETLTAQLRAADAEMLDALEALMACDLAAAGGTVAQLAAQRSALRETIAALKEGQDVYQAD